MRKPDKRLDRMINKMVMFFDNYVSFYKYDPCTGGMLKLSTSEKEYLHNLMTKVWEQGVVDGMAQIELTVQESMFHFHETHEGLIPRIAKVTDEGRKERAERLLNSGVAKVESGEIKLPKCERSEIPEDIKC